MLTPLLKTLLWLPSALKIKSKYGLPEPLTHEDGAMPLSYPGVL